MNPGNAWATRITAAAGTSLAGPYSAGTLNPPKFRRDLYHHLTYLDSCCFMYCFDDFFMTKFRRACSLPKAVYTPKGFILHAASLPQAFAHWGRFLTAATRRCLGSVSVPVLGIALSRPLPVIALVSHHLTNKLIGRTPISNRENFTQTHVAIAPC